MCHSIRTRLILNPLEDRAVPAGFAHVYHAHDGATLAAAVATADGQAGTSKIVLDRAGTYAVPATLQISADITIVGSGTIRPGSFVIQPAAGVQDRVMDVTGADTLTLNNLTVRGGTTTGDGGGIEASAPGTTLRLVYVVVRDNTAAGNGGGIDVADGTLLSLFHTQFIDNVAGADGGGAYFAAASQSGTVALSAGLFTDNTAGGSTSGDGGGLDVVAPVPAGGGTPASINLNINGTQFNGNGASHDGGAVWASDVGTVEARSVVLRDNTAAQDAGGLGDSVMNLDAASFTFNHGTVTGNRVTGPGTGTTPDGGGVCFDFQGAGASGNVTATVLHNHFTNNSVAGAGGGLFLRDDAAGTTFNATVSANGFSGNATRFSPVTSSEDGDGAGAYIAAAAGSNTVTANENTITHNGAAGDGGGLALRLDTGTASVSNNTILSNQAGQDGGGVYLTGTPGGTVLMQSDVIENNSAGVAGGGVFNDSDTVIVRRSTVTRNTAPTSPNFSGTFQH